MPFKICTSILKMTSSSAMSVMLNRTFLGVLGSWNLRGNDAVTRHSRGRVDGVEAVRLRGDASASTRSSSSSFFTPSQHQFDRCMGWRQGYRSFGPRKFLAASHSSSTHREGLTKIASR
jgi:hypothetical protein